VKLTIGNVMQAGEGVQAIIGAMEKASALAAAATAEAPYTDPFAALDRYDLVRFWGRLFPEVHAADVARAAVVKAVGRPQLDAAGEPKCNEAGVPLYDSESVTAHPKWQAFVSQPIEIEDMWFRREILETSLPFLPRITAGQLLALELFMAPGGKRAA
jgi:hypothetical protein